ncbi:hypothetical protein P4H66_08615 [Paenibacillus dokdonensis]|uniref:Uncharacterized protein n=1 Tax=Paenibacillus dokdonensis TaxID=2567944 RepID=A0ABU6GJJ5_9BACL|nr:hypothetical protein [Paenibacillus dokdonensis]MEC0239911.1 hypothetical protein [Paenibacillus dokdonensis]
MLEWHKLRKEQLASLELQTPDADTVIDELTNTLRLIEQGIGIYRYIHRMDMPDLEAERRCLKQLKAQLETAVAEFNRLWRIRNREGGLVASHKAMHKLLVQYEEHLAALDLSN